jgi:hypothetical protein
MKVKEPQYDSTTSRTLWCIDRNPAEVNYEWIMRNAFQLQDSDGIAIGGFTLKRGPHPGRLWLTDPAGHSTELDERVLEDLLRSFF